MSFLSFCAQATIPSRDGGMMHFDGWFGTQRWIHDEIQAGRELGIRDYVILKGGRQIGGSTYLDVLTAYHLMRHPGMVGLMVSDDEANRDYRRDVILEMLEALPPAWKHPIRMSNKNMLAWDDPCNSRLLFDYAGVREGSNLGRSRGANYGYFDEIGSWPEQQAVAALRASLSEKHPHRFYAWVSTARGIDTVFHEMWKTAETATTTRAIFAPWWRREDNRVMRGTEQWTRYCGEPTRDEWHWMDTVKRRYDVEIEPGQLFWYRWKLREECYGDEAMRAQEYGSLPEECFQAFGSKFIGTHHIRRMRTDLDEAPPPQGFTFTWGPLLDDADVTPAEPRASTTTLRVWEEPPENDEPSVYVIAVHPWGSSTPAATMNVVEVFRAWPDHLVQVAEYASPTGTTEELAWVTAYLAGIFRHPKLPPYLHIEVGGDGMAVLSALTLMSHYGYSIKGRRGKLRDLVGSINHHFYVRPDRLTRGNNLWHSKSSAALRMQYFSTLRSSIERERITLRSSHLLDELAMLRRGEAGASDQLGGGGQTSDARAYALALVTETWLQYAMNDGIFTKVVAPMAPKPARHVSQAIVQGFMQRLLTTGRI